MIAITVARKPLVGTVAENSLAYGTGGLNIDACRIDGAKGWPDSKQYNPGFLVGGSKQSATYQDNSENPSRSKGRWPANFILEHLPGCQCVGAAKIAGNRTDTRPDGDAGREDRSQWRFRPTAATRRGYADEDGQETVSQWECAPGCPVADLDGQSGWLSGRGNTGVTTRQPSHGAVGWYFGPGDCGVRLTYDNGGGASRFFKQIGGQR
jgi:site-specific DNA-methyltransferase (adenine-specific)